MNTYIICCISLIRSKFQGSGIKLESFLQMFWEYVFCTVICDIPLWAIAKSVGAIFCLTTLDFNFTISQHPQAWAAAHTCAFVLFLILKRPGRSIPEGRLQQGLEYCPYGFTGLARYTLSWTSPEANRQAV